MTEAYYKLTVSTPFGDYDVLYLGIKQDAKKDVKNALVLDMNIYPTLIKVSNPSLINNPIHRDMYPLRGATVDGKQWAWVKRIK